MCKHVTTMGSGWHAPPGNLEISNKVTNGSLNALLSSALSKLQSKLYVLASSLFGMTIQ